MVILNGTKFACSACIKGHRSSRCAHTNRTLVEIGKKGRPPTQCAHCRELRRTSKVHSKCMCGDKPSPARQLQILPSGIANQLTSSASDAQADTIQLINQIFNTCSCSIGGPCSCSSPAHPTVGSRASNPKKKVVKSCANDVPNDAQQPMDHPSNQSTSRPPCCSNNSNYTESSVSCIPPATLPSTSSSTATTSPPHLTSDALPPISSATPSCHNPSSDPSCNTLSTSNPSTFDPSAFTTEPALFAPQTAGTALCFCGIHCPCPGCALHDPLGLKFITDSNTLCPTSMVIAQDCIAGLDLPTVNQLLNLSPMAENFSKTGSSSTEAGSPPPVVNLPSVSQAFGIPPLSTSTELSLSQTSAYLMMGQPSNSTTFGSTSGPKSFDANTFESSCCGTGFKKKTPDISHHSEPSSRGCCSALKTNHSHLTSLPSNSDEGQQLKTLNKFDLSGCCKMDQINSTQPAENLSLPYSQSMSVSPCIL